MTVEIPVFKRCCFCVPLRAGLLAWGYFKIIADALITPILAYFVITNFVMSLYGTNKSYLIWILLYSGVALLTLIMFITDFVATIVFIVGGHKKNAKLIRGFYIYSIGVLIVTTLISVVAVGLFVVNWVSQDSTYMILVVLVAFLLSLAIQAYFILLLRSEVNKLNNTGEYQFVNNSTEAQIMMTAEEKEAKMEKV